jgi:hypothetical protein
MFQFYGAQYYCVWVCSNGYLSFESNYTTPTPPTFNGDIVPNSIVAGLWRPLTLGSGSITYYMGESILDVQVFVVTWNNVVDVSTGATETFQIILIQGPNTGSDGDIYIQYASITTNTPTFVGVINPDVTEAVSFPINDLPAGNCHLHIPCLPYNSTNGSIDTPGAIRHVTLTLQKGPGDDLAELDDPQVQSSSVVLNASDIYNPVPVVVWAANTLYDVCSFGASLTAVESNGVTMAQAATIQYTDALDIVTSGTKLLSDFFGTEMSRYIVDLATDSCTFVTAGNIYAPLPFIGDFDVWPSLENPGVDQSIWMWYLGNPRIGLTGFNSSSTSQAALNGEVFAASGTLLPATDMALAMQVLWKFDDVPTHVMDHTLNITATVEYQYNYGSCSGSGGTAYGFLSTSVILTEVCEGPPTISSPGNVRCLVGAGSITWGASSASPDYYTVQRMNSVDKGQPDIGWETVCNETWNGGSIKQPITDLPVGANWLYKCTVYDVAGYSAQSTILVTIVCTPPTINSPPNLICISGTTGNTITWIPSSGYPSSYAVTGTEGCTNSSGTWNGGAISVDVDGLALGSYTYTCTVWDQCHQSASDSVGMTVKPPITSISIPYPPNGVVFVTSSPSSSVGIEIDVNIACSYLNPSDSTNIVRVLVNGKWYTANYGSSSTGNYIYYYDISLPGPSTANAEFSYAIQAEASENNGATWINSGTNTIYVQYTPPSSGGGSGGSGGGGGGGCPYLFVYNGSVYYDEGLLNIHTGYNDTDLVVSQVLDPGPNAVNGTYMLRLTEDWSTLSYINQVKLYATLSNGMTIQLPLISAVETQVGNVLPQLLFDDNLRAVELGAIWNNGTSQSINLRFLALPWFINVAYFTFVIIGYNPVKSE